MLLPERSKGILHRSYRVRNRFGSPKCLAGRRMVGCSLHCGKQEDIFIMRKDGTGRRQLTNDLHRDRRPRHGLPTERDCVLFSIGAETQKSGPSVRTEVVCNTSRRLPTKHSEIPPGPRTGGGYLVMTTWDKLLTFLIQIRPGRNRSLKPCPHWVTVENIFMLFHGLPTGVG